MSDNELPIGIRIVCPACSQPGQIKIKENVVETSTSGVTAINVAEGLICEHSFVAYIDKNLDVRDCFICDFTIELPDVEMTSKQPFSISGDYDVSIIKLNLLPSLMVYVLKGIFLGKKIVILFDNDFISNHFLGFFKNITINSFNLELTCISEKVYKNNKKNYKDYLVFKNIMIVNDRDKIIHEKNLKIERTIVQKFFAEANPKVSVIVIKNEISKICIFVKALIDFNKDFNKKNPFTMRQVVDFFKKEFKAQLQFPFLEFLENIAIKGFNIELHRTDKFTDFLGIL